ncbi:MAG: hypothetical protein ACQKBW_02910, partial [Puniceicoccales bacterium]
MRLYTMITPNSILKIIALASLAAVPASATVITGITPVNGPGDVIAPDRTPNLIGTGSTSQATLEARSDLLVLQTFTGVVTKTTSTFSFENATTPDVQISLLNPASDFWGSTATNTVSDINASSFGSAFSIQTPKTVAEDITYGLQIDFGSYDSGSDQFTTDTGVYASAFTLNGDKSRMDMISSIVVEFNSTSGQVLSTQTILGSSISSATGSAAMYFGYETTDELIGSITISI